MVFSSLIFLFLFFPICLIIYYLSPGIRAKNITLTLLSLVFYAWGEPLWILLLLFTSVIEYFIGRGMGGALTKGNKAFAKGLLVFGIVVDIGFLALFKYTGFFISNANALGAHLPGWELALPLGISFYTFQAISYLIDVYREETPCQRSFMDFLLFKALFPQLVAGPILRYSDIAEQIRKRSHSFEKFASGATRFCVGLGKKVLIANYCGSVVDKLLGGFGESSTVLGGWLGILMYAFQIYFDFSAYSDMAIGLGKMFGFVYKENFNYPYISVSITDFWRRWHISLSSFFRDYVYIPLGGNRKHQLLNILIVWALTGFWHGASWNFVLWGLYFALLLIVEKVFLLKLLDKLPRFLTRIYALFFVLMGWVFFYFESVESIAAFFSLLFGFSGKPFTSDISTTLLINNSLLLVICVVASTPLGRIAGNLMRKLAAKSCSGANTQSAVYLAYDLAMLMVCTAVLVSSSYNPFLYFRF